jgi:DNA polymerase III epsilon subunit-like protein
MKNLRENICFIDFETTGSNLFEDEPIEIGAILVNDHYQSPIEFKSFIKPSEKVKNTTRALQIHGVKIKELINEPEPSKVLLRFFDKFGTNYCFAGWNISFDIPFFKKIVYENGFQQFYDQINYRHLDVQSICRTLKYLDLVDQKLNSLSDFTDYFGIKRSKTHDALEDAKITYHLFTEVISFLDESIAKKDRVFD